MSNFLTGAPVRKAKIAVAHQGASGTVRETISGADGRFFIGGISPGAYRISVEREGFLPVSYGWKSSSRPENAFILTPGQVIGDLHISLQPPGVISGHVLDEDGEPVEGISLEAIRADFARGPGQYAAAATAVTDDTGTYRLFGLPAGRYRVVSIQRPANGTGIHQPGIPESVYQSVFYPGAPDFGSAVLLNIAPGAEAREIDLRIAKSTSVSIRGAVTGQPALGANPVQVRAIRKDRAGIAIMGAQPAGPFSGEGAQFEFHGLTPGAYILSGALRDGTAVLYGREEIEVGASDVNAISLPLSRGLELEGRITFLGGPAPSLTEARVSLSRTDPFAPSSSAGLSAGLNSDHSFVLTNVMPGRWRVAVTLEPFGGYIQSIRMGEQDGLAGELEVGPSLKSPLQIVAAVKGATVQGTVYTTDEAAPRVLEGAAVLLAPSGEHARMMSDCTTTASDREGHYRLTGLAPGPYRLWAFRDLEAFSCRDQDLLKTLEGGGREIRVALEDNGVQDLTVQDAP